MVQHTRNYQKYAAGITLGIGSTDHDFSTLATLPHPPQCPTQNTKHWTPVVYCEEHGECEDGQLLIRTSETTPSQTGRLASYSAHVFTFSLLTVLTVAEMI